MAKISGKPQGSMAPDSPDTTPGPREAPRGVGSYDRGRVAMRAYELFMARGASDGADLDDWLRAEREFDSKGAGDPRGQ